MAELAGRQHGVVSIRQLRALGASKDAVSRRVAAGRLHRVHRRVYAVGHTAPTWDARCLAAVMSFGSEALLTHRAAAHRWLLVSGTPAIEITAPRGCAPREGIVVHRSRAVAPEDRTVLDGIPVTTVARTLVDLAEVLTERRLADAVHQAEFHRVLDLNEIDAALGRVPGRASRHKLHRALASDDPPPASRNDGERLLHELCVQHGLPRPQANASVGGLEVDLYWPEAGLVVELDGRDAHMTRRAFREDRRRDRALAARGIQVMRVTDVAEAAEIRAVYAIRT
ncbi:MAG: type IV toxin-antitoxin system AbiEi family antitoxin domain-containing protein [Thermoleophilaceae bacterium]|nr:type IV toxin-antitoxin system AbiEi family antitoxin domain-containing protein [Thermoleophilaceae bacterium]